MVGTAGIVAFWMLAATPAGAIFDVDDQTNLVRRAVLRNEVSVRGEEAAMAGNVAARPRSLPYDPAYEPAGLATASSEDGIPGLPPIEQPIQPPSQEIDKVPETSVPKVIERHDFIETFGDSGHAFCSDDIACDSCTGSVWARSESGFRRWFEGVWWEGWIDQGFTLNTLSPRNRINGPVTFNNRSNEYQLNQLYMRLARDVDLDGCRWDVGGRVDLLYGTDSIYVTARGLEVWDDLSQKWNAQRYGLAMPQCYAEVFSPWGNGLSVKLGHFYSIVGYESVEAPKNFFYSHSYLEQYAEPFTDTGLLAQTRLGKFDILAGMTRGDNNWEDNNNDLGFTGGIRWANRCQRTKISFCVDAAREQPDPSTNVRTLYSLVVQQKLGQRWECVLQYDHGNEPGAGIDRTDEDYYGVCSYLFYTISDAWKAGMRFEWFRDGGGARVTDADCTADYFELSYGLDWTPSDRLTVRPELRWDWTGTAEYYPFGDGTRSNQLLLDCDVIVRF